MSDDLIYGDGPLRHTNCLHRENDVRCRRRARYFGRWAGGGLCYEHVDDPSQLHAEDRERYDQETAHRGKM